jgi:hypothetical protein
MTAAQRKIERAYQRAMNIRDSTPSPATQDAGKEEIA